MGMGTIINGVRADAAAGLREWGAMLTSAAKRAPANAGPGFAALPDGLATLRPIDEAAIRTTGWELRDAFRNSFDDGLCVQRAALGTMSLLQRVDGSIPAALGDAAQADARGAAMLVAYDVQVGATKYNLHAAPGARTADGRVLVIDHLVGADTGDGVLELDDWLQRIHGSAAGVHVVPATRRPPLGAGTHAGIGPITRPATPETWGADAETLASSLEALVAGQPFRRRR
jgi:hypothetical protein